MTTREEAWPPGTPCWVDYSATDVDAAIDFYGSLFGWEAERSGEEFGGYVTARLGGRDAAGIGPKQGPPDAPPGWTTYFATTDVDESLAKVREAGGQVLAEAMDIADMGRMGVAMDPQGAVHGFWQAGTMLGCAVVDEPGGFTWCDGMVLDAGAAREFYTGVLGWTYEEMPGAGHDYKTFMVDGRVVGGLGNRMAEEAPPYWLVYFGVQDADDTIQAVSARGGSTAFGPMDTPFGRMAVLLDPWGAPFAIMGATSEEAAAQA